MEDQRAAVAVPYLIFLYAMIVFVLVGGSLGAWMSPQWRIVFSELGVLLVVTLFARLFVKQTLIELHLPTLLPKGSKEKGNTLLSVFSPRRNGVSPYATLLMFCAVPPLALLANLLALLLAQIPYLKPSALGYAEQNADLFPVDQPWVLFVGVFGVVVAAPIAEEFLFRGTLLPLLKEAHPKFPLWAILLINGILFGLVHFNILVFIALTLVGYYFADVTTRAKTVLVPIGLHALFNFCNVVVFPYVGKYLQGQSDELKVGEFGWQSGLALVVVTLLFVSLWMAFRRHTEVTPLFNHTINYKTD